MENEGIKDDDRNEGKTDQGQRHIHREHDNDSRQDQQQDTDDLQKLFGNELPHGLDVGGAALDNVAGLRPAVPGKRLCQSNLNLTCVTN